MSHSLSFHSGRRLLLAAAGALVLGVAFTACDNGTSAPPVDPNNPCAADAALCTPLADLLENGEVAFGMCSGCHGSEGRGSAGGTPPLANSDYFMSHKTKTIAIVLGGYDSPITVNGLEYQGTMPSHHQYSDLTIASVLTYLRVSLNDSLVVSCDPENIDLEGFPVCQKTARTQAERNADTVAVWQVKAVRDSLGLPAATE